MRQIDSAQFDMRQQTSGGSDHDIGPHFHPSLLLFPGNTVRASVDGNGGNRDKIGKTFDLLVDLLGQFACGSHDDGIDGIGRM